MRTVALILLLICLSLLTAQSIDLQNLRLKVAQNPVDAASRLNLAYQLMLAGNTVEALNHYETLLKQDASNAAAMEGILWALQSQKRFDDSIRRADGFLKILPSHATVYNYKAFALSQKGLHLAARGQYSIAHKLAVDAATKQAASSGLAWEYLFLGNYAAASAKLSKLGNTSDPQALDYLHKARLKVALGASSDLDNLHSGSITGALHKAQWGFRASYGELFLSGSRFRKRMGTTADWQNPVANLKASVHTMIGNDKRVYPATQYSLSIEPIYYVDKLQVSPSLSAHYGSYQRFDVQQADLELQISSDDLSGGYSISKLYQDNDAMGSDTDKMLHSLNLGVRVFRQSWLTGYLFEGNQAWWNSPYGVIYDDFEANSSAYGLSLSSPIGKQMGILLYSQIGKHNDKTELSTSLTLSYSM